MESVAVDVHAIVTDGQTDTVVTYRLGTTQKTMKWAILASSSLKTSVNEIHTMEYV